MSKHSEIAAELYSQGYNCSQSVFTAFCDVTGLEKETALKISSSFGGGMGRLREVCGAVTGAFMVLGVLYGQTDPADKAAKSEHYQRIHDLGTRFRQENDSYLCRELLHLDEQDMGEKPADKSESYLVKNLCPQLVKDAARMVDEYIEKAEAEAKAENPV